MVDVYLRPNHMLFIRNSVHYEHSERLQIKASKTICSANLNQMKAEIAILILEKSTSEQRLSGTKREGHCMVKGWIFQDDTSLPRARPLSKFFLAPREGQRFSLSLS